MNLLHNAIRVGRNPMLRADSLHAYVFTRRQACSFTCLHACMRTCMLAPKNHPKTSQKLPKNLPEISQNPPKILPKSFQNPPQILPKSTKIRKKINEKGQHDLRCAKNAKKMQKIAKKCEK